MNFDFIPYRLNADISDFKDNIEYISSDNGVDLYKARDALKLPVLGFQVKEANLYFFEGSLITVYIRLKETTKNIETVREALNKSILETAKVMSIDTCLMYYWQDRKRFLGVTLTDSNAFVSLYFSLGKYCVF